MAGLKLIALDAEDLAVLSVHLQDAVISVGDMTYLPKEHRFVLLANRFDWEKAVQAEVQAQAHAAQGRNAAPLAAPCVRRRSGMHFERVMGAKVRGIDLSAGPATLNLLAVTFEETDAPSGLVTFLFSGGAEVQLSVECLEAGLEDLGPAWDAKGTPCHDAAE
ncbi:DUF2948 family protein [Ancylobacter sp. A5.8]|uniref:DUF2948 family protein n=1 Tax=Ancylobacter gelatini TaxID=2919920 RepID=UPI001F4E2844|nr:DUF2948 family protein [Ancylobacter gelatini]MCJ8142864.1 DUF2948 family protein [Ancylobacter gelatini]